MLCTKPVKASRRPWRGIIPALVVAALTLPGVAAIAGDHGVVLMYHHVNLTTPAITSVTPERFEQHLDYLEQQGFVVLPLSEMLGAIYARKPLAENAVAITFDDAYESVFTEAWPRLSSRRMPFTVFVSTNEIDNRFKGYMSWAQMRKLDPALASFGSHSRSHAHLVERRNNESHNQWRGRMITEVQSSVERIKAELGVEVDSFAYPYGEYDGALMKILQTAGLYGLGQHSGAVGPAVNPREVPRFPMATGYDDLARFITAINSRPMPVKPSGPNATVVAQPRVPDSFLLQVQESLGHPTDLACYAGGNRLPLTISGGEYRVELPTLRPGRNKVNCTAPSRDQPGEYFWHSKLWIVADEEGTWLRE